MLTTTETDEYLAEVRSQVCANCVDRPEGGPPCAPRGKVCGVEQHLPELIDAIHAAHMTSSAPYFESTQRQICDHCSFRHSRFCPCPMDSLLVLIMEAVEAVDARHERREKGRRRPAGLNEGADLAVIRQLHKEAAGTWTGCDWPTRFGKFALDLNGCTAAEASRKASSCRGTPEAADWRAAVTWLATIERSAKQAERAASAAVRAAAAGTWPEALEKARKAWESEFATGRMVWRGFPMTWERFFLAVESAAAIHPNAGDA